jgi:hypothetical protein
MPTDPAAAMHERIARARAATAARAAAAPPAVQQAETGAQSPSPAIRQPSLTAHRGEAGSTPGGSMTAQQRMVWDIVRAAQLAGARDLTRREAWQRWCAQSGRPQSDGAMSGRINELLGMGWLQERPEKRASADSQALSRPVYVPSHLLNAAPAQGR